MSTLFRTIMKTQRVTPRYFQVFEAGSLQGLNSNNGSHHEAALALLEAEAYGTLNKAMEI